MQPNKNNKKTGELEMIISDSVNTTDALTDVMDKFNTKKIFRTFDNVKRSGVEGSKILAILLILPFYQVASIMALFKSGLQGVVGKKDVYYDFKNNEKINWRMLLTLIANRFLKIVPRVENNSTRKIRAIIFDDSPVEKTTKKTEGVSLIHDHVTDRFIFGYKLLVCGYFDGTSFIPIDFSLHREKGKALDTAQQTYKTAQEKFEKAKVILANAKAKKTLKKQNVKALIKCTDKASGKTHQNKIMLAKKAEEKAEGEFILAQKDVAKKKRQLQNALRHVKETEKKHPAYGLNKTEKKEQYRKTRKKSTFGYERFKESDSSKIENMLNMLRRAVKNGFVADYVLTDSWFFCYELLHTLHHIAKGQIHLISMVKMGNQKFTMLQNGKEYSIKPLLKLFERKAQYCKKLKAHYIKVQSTYKGIRVNMFYVKMGRSNDWKLLVTTDLNLNFIQLLEVYKIRWSIEVFFKEGKQHLNLGQSLSQNFDAQIADTTMSMVQYIMLCYYKRIHYQQSIGYLFAEISKEMIEKNIAERLWDAFVELQSIIGDIAGFDVLDIYQELFRKKETAEIINRIFISPSQVNNAA